MKQLKQFNFSVYRRLCN